MRLEQQDKELLWSCLRHAIAVIPDDELRSLMPEFCATYEERGDNPKEMIGSWCERKLSLISTWLGRCVGVLVPIVARRLTDEELVQLAGDSGADRILKAVGRCREVREFVEAENARRLRLESRIVVLDGWERFAIALRAVRRVQCLIATPSSWSGNARGDLHNLSQAVEQLGMAVSGSTPSFSRDTVIRVIRRFAPNDSHSQEDQQVLYGAQTAAEAVGWLQRGIEEGAGPIGPCLQSLRSSLRAWRIVVKNKDLEEAIDEDIRLLTTFDPEGFASPTGQLLSRPLWTSGQRNAEAVVAARGVLASLPGPPPLTSGGRSLGFSFQLGGATIPETLREAYRARKLVVFLGSGVSLGSGFPSWARVGQHLLEEGARHGLSDLPGFPLDPDAGPEALRDPAVLDELLDFFDEAKMALGTTYNHALQTIFLPQDCVPGPVHAALRRLPSEIPILTANYEQLAETATSRQVFTWLEADNARAQLRRRSVLKVHGCATRPDSIVLSRSEYRRIGGNSVEARAYRHLLEQLLTDHTFLFVGFGLNDPLDLDRRLSIPAKLFRNSGAIHYALMRNPTSEETTRYRRMKVLLVPYQNHDEVPGLLKSLLRE